MARAASTFEEATVKANGNGMGLSIAIFHLLPREREREIIAMREEHDGVVVKRERTCVCARVCV